MSIIPAFEIGFFNAWIFMSVFLIQALAIRFFFKELYEKTGHPSGMKLLKGERLMSQISFPTFILASIYSIFLPLEIGTIWFYIGLAIFLLGLIILIITTVNFLTTSPENPVTTGMYHYSRHPMYLATDLVFFSVSIATISWVFFLLSILMMVILRFASISEERFCLGKYGDIYREYINKIPRWIKIPRLSMLSKKEG